MSDDTSVVGLNMRCVVEQAIATLNRMLEKDPDAIVTLVNLRIPVNDAVANETPARCRPVTEGAGQTLGLLGVINGILDPTGTVYGPIMIRQDAALPLGAEFVLASEPVHRIQLGVVTHVMPVIDTKLTVSDKEPSHE